MMNAIRIAVAVIGLAALAAGEPQPPYISAVTQEGKGLLIAEKGRALVTVVMPDDAHPGEELAASEIADYLGNITGATFNVVREGELKAEPALYVGRTTRGKALTIDAKYEQVYPDSFRIRIDPRRIVIRGGGVRGTIYGVYDFLEMLGCRFYAPGELGEEAPRRETLAVRPMDRTQSPDMEIRAIPLGKWSLKTRQNFTGRQADAEARNLRMRWGLHAWPALINHRRYFEEHPEYFPLFRGCRGHHVHSRVESQLCTMNPETVLATAREIGEVVAARPSVELVGMYASDVSAGWCECAACAGRYGRRGDESMGKFGRHSRRYMDFVNAVAAVVEPMCPRIRLAAGSYHDYALPAPRSIPRKNVAIWNAMYQEACVKHRVDDPSCEENQWRWPTIAEWIKRADTVFLYEYYYKAKWYNLPAPIERKTAADLRTLAKMGVRGLTSQASSSSVGNLGRLYYVASRCMWNTQLDYDALMDDYFTGYFREAADPMRDYYRTLERAFEAQPVVVLNAWKYCTRVFSREFFVECEGHLDRAEASAAEAAAKEDRVKQRIAQVRTAHEMARLVYEAFRAQEKYERKATGLSPREYFRLLTRAKDAWLKVVEYGDEHASDGAFSWWRAMRESYVIRLQAQPLLKQYEANSLMMAGTTHPMPTKWWFRKDAGNVGLRERWFAPDFSTDGWQKLKIGATWESQLGEPYDGYAWYRCKLAIPTPAKGKQMRIFFGGVDGEGWVYLNGKFVGCHKGWNDPFDLDLTPHVIAGKPNCLAVRVYDGAGQGGIYRPVLLLEVGAQDRPPFVRGLGDVSFGNDLVAITLDKTRGCTVSNVRLKGKHISLVSRGDMTVYWPSRKHHAAQAAQKSAHTTYEKKGKRLTVRVTFRHPLFRPIETFELVDSCPVVRVRYRLRPLSSDWARLLVPYFTFERGDRLIVGGLSPEFELTRKPLKSVSVGFPGRSSVFVGLEDTATGDALLLLVPEPEGRTAYFGGKRKSLNFALPMRPNDVPAGGEIETDYFLLPCHRPDEGTIRKAFKAIAELAPR